MNLWMLFPDSILNISGILKLPYFAIVFYLFTFVFAFKLKNQRTLIMGFLSLSVISSLIMIANFGPQVGHVIPPLSLLLTAVFPSVVLIQHVLKRRHLLSFAWSVMTVAGILHGLSWGVWLTALARS
ncbi:hypothetical protein AB6E04_16735 [Vibrio amylolyticus]|uniref:hypothetical protein n=1 Tax=Vibrio amylolyticus TaxID=2847292 RepID=UPI0035537542